MDFLKCKKFLNATLEDLMAISGYIMSCNDVSWHVVSLIEEFFIPFSRVYVARCVDDTYPMGFAVVREYECAELIMLCVDPKYRRLGIGEFLLNELLQLYPCVVLQVKRDNIPAFRLYTKMGFKILRKGEYYEMVALGGLEPPSPP